VSVMGPEILGDALAALMRDRGVDLQWDAKAFGIQRDTPLLIDAMALVRSDQGDEAHVVGVAQTNCSSASGGQTQRLSVLVREMGYSRSQLRKLYQAIKRGELVAVKDGRYYFCTRGAWEQYLGNLGRR
jgi:hypothetical protein